MHPAPSELIVHHDAIHANVARFNEVTQHRVMAVPPAGALGHGAVARTALDAGARAIGVAALGEAFALRSDGVGAPILSWLNAPDADFVLAAASDIEIAVPGLEHLHALARAARIASRAIRVHLHVDIGMARDGCAREDWSALCTMAYEHQAAGRIQVVGVMGHLSCADVPEHPQNVRERMVFRSAVHVARRRGLAPRTLHLAGTAATLTGQGAGFDLHRIGAGLLGIDPSHTTSFLRPALSLTSRVVSSRSVARGTAVGSGLDFVSPTRTNLALLPIGSGDGLPLAASHRAEVFARGRRRPLVGRISRDMVVIDTGDDQLSPSESITVFGPGDDGEPTVAEWAMWSDTVEQEITTRIGVRASRVHLTHARGESSDEEGDHRTVRALSGANR